MAPVLTTLMCGSQSDKEELDKEVQGVGDLELEPLTPKP